MGTLLAILAVVFGFYFVLTWIFLPFDVKGIRKGVDTLNATQEEIKRLTEYQNKLLVQIAESLSKGSGKSVPQPDGNPDRPVEDKRSAEYHDIEAKEAHDLDALLSAIERKKQQQ